jgi:hypothetical protein
MFAAAYTPRERRTKKRGFVVAQTTLPHDLVTHEQEHDITLEESTQRSAMWPPKLEPSSAPRKAAFIVLLAVATWTVVIIPSKPKGASARFGLCTRQRNILDA